MDDDARALIPEMAKLISKAIDLGLRAGYELGIAEGLRQAQCIAESVAGEDQDGEAALVAVDVDDALELLADVSAGEAN